MRILTSTFLIGLLLTIAGGCGQSSEGTFTSVNGALGSEDGGGGPGIGIHNYAGKVGDSGLRNQLQQDGRSVEGVVLLDKSFSMPKEDQASEVERKTIFTADVFLIVEDLDALSGNMASLLKRHDAKIAAENRGGSKGQSRSGTWKVRVPVKEFDSFLAAVAQLGELERTSTNSQDVTEEFYDLTARIEQKTVEEKGLLKLQEEAAAILNKDPKARMEDLLAVRKEWANVRQEIERMQGRLKLLTHLTELTTVTITVNERKGYVPPTQPGFGTQITRTFEGSLSGLQKFGQGIVLVAVAVSPWLVLLAVVFIPAILTFRWLRRRPPVTSSNP